MAAIKNSEECKIKCKAAKLRELHIDRLLETYEHDTLHTGVLLQFR